ncbi:hypothetical protein ACFFUS_17355 [Vibrio gallaecicus]|uniref:hypothetical protein n=1 Tax=Vibrio gallaecicus TaxID=552386 RepID=UPI0010C99643|nr:hypothetical protein [Vibrio gallaecicus]MDN3614826.1 hypothetical protein [Vibrio gallaecicus]
MIYVAFSKDEVINFQLLAKKDDVILSYTDSLPVTYGDNVYDVTDFYSEINSKALSNEVRFFFEKFSDGNPNYIQGYGNNFLECSILIFFQYFYAIKFFSKLHNDVFFKNKILGKGNVNYYLSEHESQSVFLYDRSSALQYSLEKEISNLGLNCKYKKIKINLQKIKNLIRDMSVFSIRLIKACRVSIQSKSNMDTLNGDLYIILRTYAQFENVKNILKSSSTNVTVICASSFLRHDLLDDICTWTSEYPLINVVSLPESNLRNVLITYASSLFKMLTSRHHDFSFDSVKLDVSQAYREVINMSSEISLYGNRLENLLSSAAAESTLLTCEQKSPHAYVEISSAKKFGFKTIQLMACDQSALDIPYPIVADIFVTDTLKRKELFTSNWSTNIERLRYLGPIRELSSKYQDLNKSTESYDYNVCYFAHVNDVQQNRDVISILENITLNIPEFNFCVKLHPRDDGSWIDEKIIHAEKVFTSSMISNEDLFDKFDIGVSNPSAIVMELLSYRKPFVFIDVMKSYKNVDFVSCDDEYAGYVKDLSNLKSVLYNSEHLNNEVVKLSERVFGYSPKVVSDISLLSEL